MQSCMLTSPVAPRARAGGYCWDRGQWIRLRLAADIDLHRDATPIYLQLAGLFRRRIESGEWPVGSQIPTLDALALEFGVARATIRQTTGLLRQEGLLARYRGRGTIVLRRPQREFWYEVGCDWDTMHRRLSARRLRHADFSSAARHAAAAGLRRRHEGRRLRLHPAAQYRGRQARGGRCGLAAQRASGRASTTRRCATFPDAGVAARDAGLVIDRVLQTVTIASADVELSALLRYSAECTARGHSPHALWPRRHAAVPLSEHQSRRCIPIEDAIAIISNDNREDASHDAHSVE